MDGKTELEAPARRRPPPANHAGSGCAVRGKIWQEKDSRLYLDLRRVNLLSLIDTPAIAAGRRLMELSYNTAWLWVMSMNRLSPERWWKGVVAGSTAAARC